jgi:hypothetical protein
MVALLGWVAPTGPVSVRIGVGAVPSVGAEDLGPTDSGVEPLGHAATPARGRSGWAPGGRRQLRGGGEQPPPVWGQVCGVQGGLGPDVGLAGGGMAGGGQHHIAAVGLEVQAAAQPRG